MKAISTYVEQKLHGHRLYANGPFRTFLTLSGTGGDTLIPFFSMNQILSPDFPQKIPNFVGGENLSQSGYFDTLLSFLKIVPRWH